MEKTPTPPASVAARNIKLGLQANGLSQNALAVKSGLPPTSLDRKLNLRPETFKVWELGDIATALNLTIDDLFKERA